MVDMDSNPSELQLTSMVIYEVLCHIGTLNSWEGVNYFRGFRCLHGAPCGRASVVVVWDPRFPTYDITKERRQRCFTLRVVLMWTIHDFPGYAIVGGFSHQGYAACPWCGPNLGVEHLQELGKQIYGGTRR
jgi:hypothetical protein